MTKRLLAIDLVRGWAMLMMALDHAMLNSYKHISAEGVLGTRPEPMPDAAQYLTRFVTHPGAPAFFFLAGLSVALFAASRRAKGLSEAEITRKLLVRGLALVVLQFTVMNWLWGYNRLASVSRIYLFVFGAAACISAGIIALAFLRRLPVPHLAVVPLLLLLLVPFFLTIVGWMLGVGRKPGPVLFNFDVLSLIGVGLVMLAFARRLPTAVVAGGSVLLLLAVPVLLTWFPLVPGADRPLVEVLLQPNWADSLWVPYPVLPWLGVIGLGHACGKWISARPETGTKLFLTVGLLSLLAWLVIRLTGSYGTLTPYEGGDWRDFLLISKYPPSLDFVAWSLAWLGLAIALYGYLGRAGHFGAGSRMLVLIGQVPLFFYLVHLQIYQALSRVPFLKGSLLQGYLACLVGLALLIPLCAGYRALKARYPNSLLQYL